MLRLQNVKFKDIAITCIVHKRPGNGLAFFHLELEIVLRNHVVEMGHRFALVKLLDSL